MLNEPTFRFPCSGCGGALQIGLRQSEDTVPAAINCPLCGIPAAVPRFGNRVLIAAGDLFEMYRATDRQTGQVVALKSVTRSRLHEWVIQKLRAQAGNEPQPPAPSQNSTMERAFSPSQPGRLSPGASPQAGMEARFQRSCYNSSAIYERQRRVSYQPGAKPQDAIATRQRAEGPPYNQSFETASPDGAWAATVAEAIRSMESRIREMAAALRSLPATPHVVRLIDFCEDDREFSCVMEFLPGKTLAALVRDSGKLDRQTASMVVRGLLAALEVIHAAGFEHGDIRPEHIVFRGAAGIDLSTAVLCGFGLGPASPSIGPPVMTGSRASLVRAPNGMRFSPQADLIAIGSILHSMVAGIDTEAQARGIPALGVGWTARFIERLLQTAGPDSFGSAAEALADLDARKKRCDDSPVRPLLPGGVDIPNLSECLYVMPATVCNLRCRFCGYSKMSLPKQIMANELFARVVTESCRFGFSRFGLTPMVGEALLDPQFPEKLEFLERCPGVAGYSFCTNFVTADAAFIRSLLHLRKLQWLSISICGHDPASFAALTETGPEVFEQLLDNLDHLAGVPSLPFPLELRVRTIRSFDPGEQTSRLGRLLRRFAARNVRIRIPHDLYSNRGGLISDEDLAGLDIALKEEAPKGNSPCVFLFYKHTVLPDGRLNACYTGDVNATMVIGDLSRQSLEEIYSLDNEAWLQLVAGQLRGNFAGICRNCTDYRSVADSHYSFRYHEKLNLRLSDFLDQLR